jgi:hypothetical protein
MNCCCHVSLITLMSRATNDIQEFVNIDKDLQTVQDISDVNIIILIYLFIKPCIIYTYVIVQVQNACQSS